MIEKMILAYNDFIKKYGFFPLGFILDSTVYAQFKKECRDMYPGADKVSEITSFLGLPVHVCSHPCGISFEIAPTNSGKFISLGKV